MGWFEWLEPYRGYPAETRELMRTRYPMRWRALFAVKLVFAGSVAVTGAVWAWLVFMFLTRLGFR